MLVQTKVKFFGTDTVLKDADTTTMSIEAKVQRWLSANPHIKIFNAHCAGTGGILTVMITWEESEGSSAPAGPRR